MGHRAWPGSPRDQVRRLDFLKSDNVTGPAQRVCVTSSAGGRAGSFELVPDVAGQVLFRGDPFTRPRVEVSEALECLGDTIGGQLQQVGDDGQVETAPGVETDPDRLAGRVCAGWPLRSLVDPLRENRGLGCPAGLLVVVLQGQNRHVVRVLPEATHSPARRDSVARPVSGSGSPWVIVTRFSGP